MIWTEFGKFEFWLVIGGRFGSSIGTGSKILNCKYLKMKFVCELHHFNYVNEIESVKVIWEIMNNWNFKEKANFDLSNLTSWKWKAPFEMITWKFSLRAAKKKENASHQLLFLSFDYWRAGETLNDFSSTADLEDGVSCLTHAKKRNRIISEMFFLCG